MIAGDFISYLGRSKALQDSLQSERMDHFRSTLRGLLSRDDGAQIIPDSSLPPGWHWCHFNEAPERQDIGRDGHEALGRFLPDLPLKRRMWAGGSIEFTDLPLHGEIIHRTTSISAITPKEGRTGRLIFVELDHEISAGDRLLLKETQNLVYREEVPAGAIASPARTTEPTGKQPELESAVDVFPDPVMLFRYSALTLNGHRIHYDADYARSVEGYRGIVFHGPLTATLMMALAVSASPTGGLASFAFRGLAAIDTTEPFRIGISRRRRDGVDLAAILASGETAMTATSLWRAG